jgi:DNA-binding transcriptional LysR family regulator
MHNIPSELLRTFICLVDLRSFTKTAARLQLSQPSVSTHIKRIQELMGGGLFDKSGPGVALTRKGAMVADYARKILSLNDELFNHVNELTTSRIRIGVPGDCFGNLMSSILMGLRSRIPTHSIAVVCDRSEFLIRQIQQGNLDVVVARTTSEPTDDPRHCWREEMAWVCSPSAALASTVCDPVPLVVHSAVSGLDELARSSLRQAGRTSHVVFEADDLIVLSAAVLVGIGLMPIARRCVPDLLPVLPDGMLPALPETFCSVYIREGDDLLATIADEFASAAKQSERDSIPAGYRHYIADTGEAAMALRKMPADEAHSVVPAVKPPVAAGGSNRGNGARYRIRT